MFVILGFLSIHFTIGLRKTVHNRGAFVLKGFVVYGFHCNHSVCLFVCLFVCFLWEGVYSLSKKELKENGIYQFFFSVYS